MFPMLRILLLFNYWAAMAHTTNDTRNSKRPCDKTNPFVDENLRFGKRRSNLPDPDAVFFTPYIKAGDIDGAITSSTVEAPFSSYESYSGFFTVNETTNANLFMWYFPCTQEDSNASLLVWLESDNKYPSSSRVFDPAGPYTRTGGGISTNENTLLDYFHVLYIDTPIGSGFSFTKHPDGHPTTIEDAGNDVTKGLKQFAKIFKEAVQNGVYLNGGDTYTSKIAVHSAWQFHQEGNSISGIHIKGIMLGNGLFDPIIMIGASDLLYQLGVADESTRQFLRSMEEGIKTMLRSDQQWNAYEKYRDMVSEINKLGYQQMDDFTTTAAVVSDDRKISRFFSQRRVKQALHVGRIPYNDIETGLCYLQKDMFTSVAEIISNLIPHTKFLFYVGQYGIKVNAAKTYDFVRYLTWPGAFGFHQLRFVKWCLADQIVGYQKTYANLTYFMMRDFGNVNNLMDPLLKISLWKRFTGLDGQDEPQNRLMIC